ncbi:hypothetical protein P376_6014 [Streptomyces sp. HCCB10043]|nr:hypothetical protein P376_6014 [Streptomyces sp. HCCB10043]
MARGREPGAYGFDERVPYALHRVHRVGLGCGDGERGDGLVPRDLPRALAEDQRVARRNPPHALVGRAVAKGLGGLRAGEQGGEVPDVELGLDQVGERQGGGGVGGAAGPGGVEDGPGSGEVARDGDAAADLDDGGVTAGPGGEMAHRAAACGEQPDAQLFVGGAAAAEDREACGGGPFGGGDADDADLVGAPVADRPQRIRVAPQELGAHGVNRAPLSAVSDGADGAEARGDTAPSHQPTHRRLHRLWTNGARDERKRRCGTCCHDNAAGEGVRAAHAGRACAPGKGPTRSSPRRQQRNCRFRELRRSGRTVSAPPRPAPRGRGGAGAARKQRRYPAIVGPLARPSPDRRYSAILSKRRPARIPCRAPWRPLHAQSGRWASPPGPVRRPRGMERRFPPAH